MRLLNNTIKLLGFGIFMPVLGSLIAIFMFPDIRLNQELIHFAIELLGTIIAISIVLLLLSKRFQKKINCSTLNYKIWVASAILAMGILDGFHAFAPPGNNFVWLHSIATFFGGLFFLGILIPKRIFKADIRLPFCVSILALLVGIASFAYAEQVPSMLSDGHFTLLARLLNVVGGVFFLLACIHLYRHYIKVLDNSYYYLAAHCLLFGVAGILFELSALWDLSWWWWHVLRLAAYVVLIFFYMSNLDFSTDNMNEQKTTHFWSIRLKLFYGFLTSVFCLALLVIYGWHSDTRVLIQLHQNFAPMHYNTALSFIIASLGCFCLIKKPTVAKILGSTLFVLTSMTLSQYLFKIDLGIDEFFIDASNVLTKVSHPGRMAPNTALCFMLVGLSLIYHKNNFIFISFILSFFILSCLAFFGYLVGVEGLYGVGTLTRMALHTTLGFLILFICLLFFYRYDQKRSKNLLWQSIPLGVLLITLVVTFYSWYSFKELQENVEKNHFESLVEEKIDVIEKRFEFYAHSLLGGVGFINGSNKVSRPEWREYVNALQVESYLPGSNGIGYIKKIQAKNAKQYTATIRRDNNPDFTIHPANTNFSDKFVITYIEPENINMEAIGLDIGFEENRRAAALKAMDTGKITLTKRIYLVQDTQRLPGFLLLVPVYDKGAFLNTVSARRKALKGWVYSPFMARRFMADLNNKKLDQIAFSVFDGDKTLEENKIFSSNINRANTSLVNNLWFENKLYLGQRTWTFSWQPTEHYKPVANDKVLLLIPIVGCMLGLLVSGLIYFLSKLYGASARTAYENRHRLESIFNNTVDSIITINTQGIVDSINPACEKLFGYLGNEMVGKPLIQLMPYETISAFENITHSIKKTDNLAAVGTGIEAIGKHKNGREFPIELSISKIKTDDLLLYTGIIRDNTERKQMENMKNEFISTVNHELRTPLTSIQTSLGLLKVDLQDTLNADDKRILELAYNNCERLSQLVNDILDVEKIAAGKMEYKLEEIEMLSLTHEVIEHNRGHANKYDIHFVVNAQVETIFCNIDKNRFIQALTNLLSNAAKFSPPGSTVEVSLSKLNADHLSLAVSDHGPGIPENFQNKIFGKFAQADTSSTRAIGGTGLGLSITKSIIEAFNGKVGFHSIEGKGSTFYFILPVIEPTKIKKGNI